MSDLLYNWAVHSASKVLLLSLGDIAGELTPGMLWLLFALMLVLAVTASALLIRLMRARKEITRLLLQFDQVATTQLTTEQQAGHTIGAGEQTTRLDPQGYFDPLTQLPNRKVIESAITAELQHCSTENRSALLILGLTNLSRVNETYGRAMGDLFLQHVTHRLRRLMGKEDILARLNSNRFAILMKGLPQPASSASIFMRNHTQNIQKSLESPYLIGGIALQGQISIGVAYIENPTYSAQKIIQHALIALRQTHNYPGLRVECFNDRLSSLLKESQQLVTDLPQAIEKGQMKIHVHPQHSLNGELIGVELLMRWQHPTLGNISPT
ncbi:MAG TPA: diguanylate cyclase, partial [Paenalcaligenes sp.]|nr:diguanylate cyclase [Paenalcaligenes sp.]